MSRFRPGRSESSPTSSFSDELPSDAAPCSLSVSEVSVVVCEREREKSGVATLAATLAAALSFGGAGLSDKAALTGSGPAFDPECLFNGADGVVG